MTDYSSLATDPKEFLALTGYTVAEFDALLPAFTACFTAKMRTTTLAGNPRQRPYVSYRNCPLPTLADKLLFILTYCEGDHAGYLWLRVRHGAIGRQSMDSSFPRLSQPGAGPGRRPPSAPGRRLGSDGR